MSISVRPITYEESLPMPEAKFEEIVNGEVQTMPPPSLKHPMLIDFLAVQVEEIWRILDES